MKRIIVCALLIPSILMAQQNKGFSVGGLKDEQSASIVMDTGGYFYLTGTTRSYGAGSDDFFVVKIDASGTILYQKTYGNMYHDICRKGIAAPGGGLILTGEQWQEDYGREDMLMLKINELGEKEWERKFGGDHTDQGLSICLSTDGYILTGYTASFGGSTLGNFLVCKTDRNGNLQWQKDYGTPFLDYGFDVIEDHEQNIYLVGTSGGFYNYARADFANSNADLLLIKTNSSGDEIWRKTIGGKNHDWGKAIVVLEDTFFILGSTQSTGEGSFDFYLVETDKNGDVLGEFTFGGSDFEYGEAIAVSSDGCLLLAGTTRSETLNNTPDIYIVKTDPEGSLIWEQRIGSGGSDYGTDLIALPDSGCMVLATIDNESVSGKDYYVFRLDRNGEIVSVFNIDQPHANEEPSVYPNPFEAEIHINLSAFQNTQPAIFRLYSNEGKLVSTKSLEPFSNTEIRMEGLANGTYIYQIIVNGKSIGGKLVKQN